jgi:hypothetical protein
MGFKNEEELARLKKYIDDLNRICHDISIEEYLMGMRETHPKEYLVFMREHLAVKEHLAKLQSDLERHIGGLEKSEDCRREE